MAIIRETAFIESKTPGLALSLLLIYPDDAVPDEKGGYSVVQLVHGMAEHKERYIPLMEFLAENGYVCCISDMRGHGQSREVQSTAEDGTETYVKGDLGYFYVNGSAAVDAVMDDIDRVGAYITERFPCEKRFLFGHSMGSLEVRRYAAEHDDQLRGLIVCGSPSSNPAAGAGLFLAKFIAFFKGDRHVSKFLDNMAFSHYGDAFEGESGFRWLSANQENVASYESDDLCGFTFTANGFAVLFRLVRDVYSSKFYDVKNKNMPIRFISGADDPCRVNDVKFNDAVKFMSDIGYKNVTSRLFPEMRHEILLESDARTVRDDILTFLKGI